MRSLVITQASDSEGLGTHDDHRTAELTARLRQMADAGATVADLVAQIRRVFPGPDVAFAVVLHLRRAFHLSVGEARTIEGSSLLGGTLYTSEQTETLIRPLIDRNRAMWTG